MGTSLPLSSARRLRVKLGGVVSRSVFHGAASLAGAMPMFQPARHGVQVERNIPYVLDGQTHHTMDVYRPVDAAEPLPMIFYAHGGAFQILSKDTHWLMGLALARLGFVVAVPNYRLAPAHRFPEPLQDCALALRFFVDGAARFGGDASKLVLAGESAGANLVASLVLGVAYSRQEPWLQPLANIPVLGVMPACGVFEVGGSHRFSQLFSNVHWFVDDRYRTLERYLPLQDGVPTDHPLASPLLMVEAGAPARPLPPFLLQVGGADHLKHDNARLGTALRRHGGQAREVEYPGEPHAFQAMVWKPQARQFWEDAAAFLASLGLAVRTVPPLV